jgi:hypothetical protein
LAVLERLGMAYCCLPSRFSAWQLFKLTYQHRPRRQLNEHVWKEADELLTIL